MAGYHVGGRVGRLSAPTKGPQRADEKAAGAKNNSTVLRVSFVFVIH